MQRMTALFSAALLAAGMMTAQAQAQQDPPRTRVPSRRPLRPLRNFPMSNCSSSPMPPRTSR